MPWTRQPDFKGVLALGVMLLNACVNPTQRAEDFAQRSGFHGQTAVGSRFRHVIYRNATPGGGGTLHVYIEGDGSPYRHRNVVAADPTPHDPLMLRLMALDRTPSVYLGRPCYLGLFADRGCAPLFWTVRRFGPEVLDSMESVLRAEIIRSGATTIELFGHSGGGTLALLLAQRVDAVSRVVTIGANLDIAAWCELHHYSPLAGSVNPAEVRTNRAGLEILHLVGEKDTNTPPFLVQAAARARGGEPVQVIADFDHNCCWQSVWPRILSSSP
jgi:pimeloyl-ACP methyl ester carboxylesterase